jgi:hypothetical protein
MDGNRSNGYFCFSQHGAGAGGKALEALDDGSSEDFEDCVWRSGVQPVTVWLERVFVVLVLISGLY